MSVGSAVRPTEGAIGDTTDEANGSGVEEAVLVGVADGKGGSDDSYGSGVDRTTCSDITLDPAAAGALVLACSGSMATNDASVATNDASKPAACSLESLKNWMNIRPVWMGA